MGYCGYCLNQYDCKSETKGKETCDDYETDRFSRPLSPYERTKAQVYATGNKWAIENFHATHG